VGGEEKGTRGQEGSTHTLSWLRLLLLALARQKLVLGLLHLLLLLALLALELGILL
jgi:hypothetical protein